jgi:hypothetical protein
MRNLLIVLLLTGCGEFVDKSEAVKTMESAGFQDIRVVGQNGIMPTLDGCARDDAVAFKVQAKNPAGKSTTATVCCGLILKACTIRY